MDTQQFQSLHKKKRKKEKIAAARGLVIEHKGLLTQSFVFFFPLNIGRTGRTYMHAYGSVTQPLSQSNYTSTNIVFRALFMTIRVHLSLVAAVFLCVVPQACCLWKQGRTTIAERGS